ncbi:hypothetical protein [Bacteroides sp.]
MKIAIFTRSMNYRLYDSAMYCIKELPYPHHRLMAKSADGYLLAMLNSNADWAINIDEDAFVTDMDALKELLEYCITNNIVNCGMPDGGVVPIRSHNPLVTNPFFNIINLAAIREKYSKEVLVHYNNHRTEFESVKPTALIKNDYSYDYFEPYCNFFVWTSQTFKTLYLNARVHEDGISTVLLNHKGNPILIHTWYSRFYDIDPKHSERINKIVDKYSQQTKESKVRRLYDKIMNEICYPIVMKIESLSRKQTSK